MPPPYEAWIWHQQPSKDRLLVSNNIIPVIHSFRHSLRDRLRAVECPSDIVDAIGGWTTEGIGQRYGKGYNLNVKAKWMKEIIAIRY